jgi:hypothetical protein
MIFLKHAERFIKQIKKSLLKHIGNAFVISLPILYIYKDCISNEQVCTRISKNIGNISQYDNLLGTVKKKETKWYGQQACPKLICMTPPEEGERQEDNRNNGRTTSCSGKELNAMMQ